MAADCEDEYADEFGDEEEDDEVVERDGVVHPMSTGVDKPSERSSNKVETVSLKEVSGMPSWLVETLAEDSEPNDSDQNDSNDEEASGAQVKPAVWAIHTQRAQPTEIIPPPPPRTVALASSTISSHRAAQYATVAARRITEYRATQAAKDQEMRRQESEHLQRLKDVRRSNKAMYESYGVTNLTPQERLARTLLAIRQQEKANETLGDFERKNRWYNRQPTRRNASADHARKLASAELCRKRQHELSHQQTTARIRTSQEQLKQEAKEIIAQRTSAYVKGSYLLKLSKKPLKSSKSPASPTKLDTT